MSAWCALILVVGLMAGQSADSDDPPPGTNFHGSSHANGLRVQARAASKAVAAGSGAEQPHVKYERLRVPDCGQNGPVTGNGAGCVTAAECPQNAGLDSGTAEAGQDAPSVWLRMREFRRQSEPTEGPWVSLGVRCIEVGADSEAGPSLAELVVMEWRRVVLPRASVRVQPPDATLVNLPTVVWTSTGGQSWQVELLGHDVAIRAVPFRYAWRFGDGAEVVSDDPGKPYPEQTVTHTFAERGESSVSVAVSFRGEYRVDGSGEWVPIPGVVTRPGPATAIRVLEQRTELIAPE